MKNVAPEIAKPRPGAGEGLSVAGWLPVAGYRGWVGSSAASAVVSHSFAIVRFYIFATSVARSTFIKFSTSALIILATWHMTNSLLSTLLNAEARKVSCIIGKPLLSVIRVKPGKADASDVKQ
jgi:hypothetical protein